MSEEGTPEEQVPLTGEVEPAGPGEWITLDEAGRRLGIDRKAVYRRIRRSKMVGKKAPNATHLLVWFPEGEEQREREQGEHGHFLVPDREMRFLELLDKATASLGRQVQQLTEEREQMRRERDQERIRNTILTVEHDALQASLDQARAELARPWYRRIFG